MVSRVVKRTPTKSLKNRSHRRRQKSPVKSAAASVVVASICTCHRHLVKTLARIARIVSPKISSPHKKGYRVLKKAPADQPDLFDDRIGKTPLLPTSKKTVFLDLDETLVHSVAKTPPERYDFVVRPVIGGEMVEYYVLKRPFVDEFLSFLSDKFEIVVFTAAIEAYASLVLDRLDSRMLISHRLYRDSCTQIEGKLVKDLANIGRELHRVVIVDDNPNCYQFQPDNAIPIKPFIDDLRDEELKKLIQFFEGCHSAEDIRDVVKMYLS